MGRCSDILGGAGWAAFGALIVAESLRMERFTSMGANLYTMPGLVPGLIGALLCLLGAALAWRGVRQQAGADLPRVAAVNARVVLTLTVTLAYAAVLIGRVPFALATFAFVATFTWLFSPSGMDTWRRALAATASGVLTTATIVVVFEQVFLVRLP